MAVAPPRAQSFWHPILDAAPIEIGLRAFDRGAVITGRSLFAIVEGDRMAQDPRFLRGLPEWINWDASVQLELPRNARVENGLPIGAEFSAHAGNRHGPDVAAWWTKTGWNTRAPPADPRLARLPKPRTQYGESIQLALPTGELVVVRYEDTIEAFVLPAGGGQPSQSNVPSRPGIRHTLFGEVNDLYLCESHEGLLHYTGTEWVVVETELAPLSCARTSDGVLWIVAQSSPSESAVVLYRKDAAWIEVPLPDGARAEEIAASGNRVWLSATRSEPQRQLVYSNQPIERAVTLEEQHLPGPLWINGITGLDVLSVDVVSVSASPAGPGTSACSSLVAWLGPKLTPELERALGAPPPRVVEVAGVVPGSIAPSASGSAQMMVVPSGKTRNGVVAIPNDYDDGVALVKRVHTALPALGARLVCAEPRVVRKLEVH